MQATRWSSRLLGPWLRSRARVDGFVARSKRSSIAVTMLTATSARGVNLSVTNARSIAATHPPTPPPRSTSRGSFAHALPIGHEDLRAPAKHRHSRCRFGAVVPSARVLDEGKNDFVLAELPPIVIEAALAFLPLHVSSPLRFRRLARNGIFRQARGIGQPSYIV